MKKLVQHTLLAAAFLFAGACDQGFDELNTNEIEPTAIDPAFILNTAIVNASFPGGILIYDMGIVQQIVTPNSGVLTGANYNQDNRNATEDIWIDYYRGVIRHTADVIAQTRDVPERSNLYNMARIVQAYGFMVLTDTYGDVPYSEAGRAFPDQIVFPAYDAQPAIYDGIIQELTQATAALNAGQPTEAAEVAYGGDIERWQKLGNSLLLRAGMRLSKVDPGRAQQVVQSAFQDGVMETNEDNFVVRHDANYTNSIGSTLNGSEANNFYLVKAFVDFLKDNDDPRLSSIAVRYLGAASGPDQTADIASTDPAVQIGMPMGFDNNTITDQAQQDGLASFYDYSQVDRTRLAALTAPMFLVTAAQTQLLLAEAAHRGWINGDPAEFYEAGVRAHMRQMALYTEASAIDMAAIDKYLADNPFDPGNALEQINDQYWVASFMNGPEAFANFRRSGFPDLAPNPFPGQDISGDFIRRLTYPNSEINVNNENLQAAVSRMGPDNLETRVWWDAP